MHGPVSGPPIIYQHKLSAIALPLNATVSRQSDVGPGTGRLLSLSSVGGTLRPL
jgi:hypothetical protein